MMTKLTIDILLKKGLPKSNHLEDLKTLNLSKMQLEAQDIDSQVFSQMLNLEELDLSNNSLSELPADLGLPSLKILNFNDNQIDDVTVLQQFPNLEEVLYEENLYLTVSDNYKACCLLPKLRRLNNKDVTSLANHVRFVNHRELSSRVNSYWEKNYKDKLPQEPSPAMIKSVSGEFLKTVGNQVKYGPNSLKDFTKWKVQIIADHLVSSLLGEKKRNSEGVSSSRDAAKASVTQSKKQTQNEETTVRTPSRRHRSKAETDSEVELSSRRHRSKTENECVVELSSKRLGTKLDTDREVELSSRRLRTKAETDREVELSSRRLRTKAETDREVELSSRRLRTKAETDREVELSSKRLRTKADTDREAELSSRRLRTKVETDNEVELSPKRLRTKAETDHEVTSPSKRLRSNDLLSIVLSPKRSSKLQESPLKCTPVKIKSDSAHVQEQARHGFLTPIKVSVGSKPSKQTTDRTVTNGKEKKDPSKKKPLDMEPLHFLQTHCKNNDSDDFHTQLWSCAFEPDLESSTSSKVATCGGGSVCVIDCETGKVLKKYKVPEEEFFALAWTTLTMICKDGQKRKINVLAAGGRFGIVRLMHPKVGLCYGEIKAHRKAISIMCFSPAQDTFLFTGSYDKRIILWDIGVPDHEYNSRASQLLTLDTTSTPLRVCPVPASPDQYLLAACEEGCFVWDITLKKQQGRRSYEVEFNFPIYNKESKDTDYHIVDGLAFLSDDLVVSKSAVQGSIYIWSWKKSFEKQKSKSSRQAEAHVLAELKWSETDIPYLGLTTSADGYYVLCGDEDGKVWMYDLESCKAELQKGVPCKALMAPTKIMDWPYPIARKEKMDKTTINTVSMDPAMKYLVALTDKNIIAIWKIL